MKKLTIKLTPEQLLGISEMLELSLPGLLKSATDPADKCAAATLIQWHLGKLKPKTYLLRTGVTVSLKLDAPVAFALQAFLEPEELDASNYIENTLLDINYKIDQAFAMPALPHKQKTIG